MKIGLLASENLTEFQLKTLMPLLKDNTLSIELAIIDNRPKDTIGNKLRKNIRRGRGGYILIMAFQKFLRKGKESISTEKLCKENGISILKTGNIYSPETADNIRKMDLDILLLTGRIGIIREPLLSITRLGILSYHHGNMRKYRGQPPGLWELYNNEKEMGITVQILSSGIDCGIPIEEKSVAIEKNDTLKKLRDRAYKSSENMMYNALKKLSDKDFIPAKIESYGKVYTLPNLRQWIILNMKILWRRLK